MEFSRVLLRYFVNLPGSPKAVRECLEVIVDSLRHGIEILVGEAGECGR